MNQPMGLGASIGCGIIAIPLVFFGGSWLLGVIVEFLKWISG